jgi:tetratricopeptide (TPR) repeat protein
VGDQPQVSIALAGLGDVAWRQGDIPGAMIFLTENLTLTREMNDLPALGNALNMIAIVNAVQGQFEAAIGTFEEARAVARRTGDRGRVAQALSNLGEVALMQHRLADARRHLQESLTLSYEVGNRFSMCNTHLGLGLVALLTDKPQEATPDLLKALTISQQIGATTISLGAMAGLARLLARGDDEEAQVRALELLTLAETHPASSPDVAHAIAGEQDRLAASLPPAVRDAARERGRALDLKQALAWLLSVL